MSQRTLGEWNHAFTSPGDDDGAFQQETVQFMNWFQAQPGTSISPKIELADLRSRGAGRGVIAVEDIEENEMLFRIPHSTVLSASSSDLKEQIPNELAVLDPWLSLVLVMIYESSKGRASRWWQYWEVLPHEFDTLVYWSPTQLAELQGSAVVSKIGKEDADKAFIASLLLLATKHAELFGAYATTLADPDAERGFLTLAHRMASLIMAYAFDIEGEEKAEEADENGFLSDDEENPPKGMVPLADMLNANGDRNNARLYHGESDLTIMAIKRIRKGEEIFNDYGALPRSDLLRRYGYITDEYKKWDVVEISTEKLVKIVMQDTGVAAHNAERRAALAQNWDLWEETFDLTRQAGNENLPNDGFDPALVQVMYILTANDVEFKNMKSARQPPTPMITPVIARVLNKALFDRQGEYSTTIAQDNILLRNPEIQGRHRMAIEVRLGEKEIIATVSQYLSQKTTPLSSEPDVSENSGGKSTFQSNNVGGKRRRMQ
ncbi:hypothetical protein MMC30_004420 [Trapelia coarctata]|nr:hypothetical protein [Trapelia coarctata]